MLVIRVLCAAITGGLTLFWTLIYRVQPGGELALADAISAADGISPVVLAATAKLEAVRARARPPGGHPNPEAKRHVEGIARNGRVAQPSDLGRMRAEPAATARIDVSVAELELEVARADVRRDIQLSFAEALRAKRRVGLAQQGVGRAEDLVCVARLTGDAGRALTSNAPCAEAALAHARAALTQAKADEFGARSALAQLLGRAHRVPDTVVDAMIEPSAAGPVEERLDVQLAEAWADVTPMTEVEARSATTRREQALSSAIRAEQEAQTAFDVANKRVEALIGTAVPGARKAFEIARFEFQAGKVGLVDVLDAEAAFNKTQTSLIDAQFTRDRALALLQRARVKGGSR